MIWCAARLASRKASIAQWGPLCSMQRTCAAAARADEKPPPTPAPPPVPPPGGRPRFFPEPGVRTGLSARGSLGSFGAFGSFGCFGSFAA